MSLDLVSIITPSFNTGAFVASTIESVLAQTYPNFEMIIVDDCSTDDGPAVIREFVRRDNRIRFYQNAKNLGPSKSRNTAIDLAKGRFIAFLDSDDIWYPEKLEQQVEFMIGNGHEFTFTAYDKISEDGETIGRVNVPKKVNHEDLLKTCSVGCLTAMYDTAKMGKVFMPEIRKRQDFALWVKILKLIPIGYGIKAPLAKYRVRNSSISGNKWKASGYQWKVYREIEKLSLVQSSYYFLHYTINGLIKTYLK